MPKLTKSETLRQFIVFKWLRSLWKPFYLFFTGLGHTGIKDLDDYAHDQQFFCQINKKKGLKIQKHLKSCKVCELYVSMVRRVKKERADKCYAELSELKRIGKLKIPEKYLNGAECPDDEEMAYYMEKVMLSGTRRKEIAEHMALCEFCRWGTDSIEKWLRKENPD